MVFNMLAPGNELRDDPADDDEECYDYVQSCAISRAISGAG